MKNNNLSRIANNYRLELFEKLLLIQQGHPGSIFSMMDLIVVLYHEGFVRFNKSQNNFLDKVLISKGHATAALYPILRDFGVLSKIEWDNWGKKKSILRVFGNKSIPGIDITSGSLGHCLGAGAGMALHYKKQKIDKKVYVIISEGELYEGSTWEAILFVKHHELENLKLIVDINSLIILGKTNECVNLDPIKKKIEGFNIECLEINGHNFEEIFLSLKKLDNCKKFSCILANTIKGKGSSVMENKKNWHYWNSMNDKDVDLTRKELKK